MSFQTIETQEELDRIIAERLKRQEEKLRAQAKPLSDENDTLKKQMTEMSSTLEASKKDREGLLAQIEELTGKVSAFELSTLKTQVALENGLPYDLAMRLQGEDEASLREDAEKLADMVRPEGYQPLKEPEQRSYAGEDRAYKKLLNDMNLND